RARQDVVVAQDKLNPAFGHQAAKRPRATEPPGSVIHITSRCPQLDRAGLRFLENRLAECHRGEKECCDCQNAFFHVILRSFGHPRARREKLLRARAYASRSKPSNTKWRILKVLMKLKET